MVDVIGFCGGSNSGKTTLVCKVIQELSRRGYRVGSIKHHGHKEPLTLPGAGKDSGRHFEAGAVRTIFSHGGGVELISRGVEAESGPKAMAAKLLHDLDLVLVEGFKAADIPKIEIVAPGEDPILPKGGEIIALARRGGKGEEAGFRLLDADDPAGVADFILAGLTPPKDDDPGVSLKINGEEVRANYFVRRWLATNLRAMVGELKGADGAGARPRIEVTLD